MRYFAYGSNMSSKRIKERCPSAVAEEVVVLSGYVLALNKRGGDGTSKANIVRTGRTKDKVYGVTYAVTGYDIDKLDRAEGRGFHYTRKRIKVRSIATNKRLSCAVYVAKLVASVELVPWDWYMAHIIAGAEEFKLPKAYIKALRKVAVKKTVVIKRSTATQQSLPFVPNKYTPYSATAYQNAYAKRVHRKRNSKGSVEFGSVKRNKSKRKNSQYMYSRDHDMYDSIVNNSTVSNISDVIDIDPVADIQVYTLDDEQAYLLDNGYREDVIDEVLQLSGCVNYKCFYNPEAPCIEIYHPNGSIVAIYYEDTPVF